MVEAILGEIAVEAWVMKVMVAMGWVVTVEGSALCVTVIRDPSLFLLRDAY